MQKTKRIIAGILIITMLGQQITYSRGEQAETVTYRKDGVNIEENTKNEERNTEPH